MSKGGKLIAYLGWEGIAVVFALILTVFVGIAWVVIATGIRDGIAQGIDNFTDRPWWANLPIIGWMWTGEDEGAADGDG